jgi:hypothetical protein
MTIEIPSFGKRSRDSENGWRNAEYSCRRSCGKDGIAFSLGSEGITADQKERLQSTMDRCESETYPCPLYQLLYQ